MSQAKVQQLYKLDRLLQEESGTLHSLQQDKVGTDICSTTMSSKYRRKILRTVSGIRSTSRKYRLTCDRLFTLQNAPRHFFSFSTHSFCNIRQTDAPRRIVPFGSSCEKIPNAQSPSRKYNISVATSKLEGTFLRRKLFARAAARVAAKTINVLRSRHAASCETTSPSRRLISRYRNYRITYYARMNDLMLAGNT